MAAVTKDGDRSMDGSSRARTIRVGLFVSTAPLVTFLWIAVGAAAARAAQDLPDAANFVAGAPMATGLQQGAGTEYDHAQMNVIMDVIKSIKHRTKTRQIKGGDNLNVMEWTTHEGQRPEMEGAVIYFKNFKSAFGYMNDRLDEFKEELPREWDDYGAYQQAAKEFSNSDIGIVNQFIIDIFDWFKGKQELIANQGGVIVVYGNGRRNERLIAYGDGNRYKDNNVAGILTGISDARNIRLNNDLFNLPSGADEFLRVIIEDPDGIVRIDVPYILYRVPD
jgi:hypothetical protein